MSCSFTWQAISPGPSFANTSLTTSQTWSTLVLSFSPLKVELVGTLGIRAVFYLLPSLLFLLFDSLIPSLAVSIKTQGENGLPTRASTGRGKKGKGGKTSQWYSIVGLSIFNVCLGVGVQAAIEFLLTEVFNVRSAMQVTTTLPMPWTIAKGVGRGLILREVSTLVQNYT